MSAWTADELGNLRLQDDDDEDIRNAFNEPSIDALPSAHTTGCIGKVEGREVLPSASVPLAAPLAEVPELDDWMSDAEGDMVYMYESSIDTYVEPMIYDYVASEMNADHGHHQTIFRKLHKHG